MTLSTLATRALSWLRASKVVNEVTMTLRAHDDAANHEWFLVYISPYGTVETSVIETLGDRVYISYIAGGREIKRWVDSYELKWVYPATSTQRRFDVESLELGSE